MNLVNRYPNEVTLDGINYQVAEVPGGSRYARSSVNPVRPQQATATTAGEGTLAVTGLWRRSQSDFSGGAGQEAYDFADSVANRYRRSVGVNPWTPGRVAQHLEMSVRASVATIPIGSHSQVFFLAGRLVWVLADKLRYSTQTQLISPTFTTVSLTGNVAATATDGTKVYYVYAAGGGGSASEASGPWAKTDFAGGSNGATGIWDFIAASGGRVFVGGNATDGTNAGKLVSLDAAAAATVVYAHPAGAAFRWGGCVLGPKGWYAWGTVNPNEMAVNARGEIYHFAVDPATGGLTKPTLVASFRKEAVYCIELVEDLAFIGTTRGFRTAAVDGASVKTGPLVQFAGVDRAVRSATSDGRFVVFSWGDMTADGATTTTWGVGRADMSYMTRPYVPAYAAAECLPAGSGSGTPFGICLVYGQPYFTQVGSEPVPFAYMDPYPPNGARSPAPGAGNTTVNLYGPDAAYTLYDQAVLETSAYTFGVSDRKTPSHQDVAIELLAAGELAIGSVVDDGAPVLSGYLHEIGSTGTDGPVLLSSAARTSGRRLYGRYIFRRGSTAVQSGPVLRSVAMFATISPMRVEQIDVPVVLNADTMSRNGGSVQATPRDVFVALKTLEATGRIVTYTEGAYSHQVRVDSVELVSASFDDRCNWWSGYLVIHLITVDSVGAVAAVSSSSAPAAGTGGSARPPAPQAGSSTPGSRDAAPAS